jgi:hypothetical protein
MNPAFVAQALQAEVFPVMFRNHPQATRPAIHGIVLLIEGESHCVALR